MPAIRTHITGSQIDPKEIAERSAAILLLACTALLLVVRGAISVGLVLLFVVSIIYFLRTKLSTVRCAGGDLVFSGAMAALFVATIVSQVSHQTFNLASLDSPSRFLLVIPIYFMLRTLPLSFLRALEIAFPISVWAGLTTSMVLPWQHLPLPGTYFVDPTNFGASILILGFLSLASVNWARRDSHGLLAFKLSAFLIGLIAAVQTGERGVWLVIPVLLLIWAIFRLRALQTAAVIGTAAVIAAGSYSFVPKVAERIAVSRTEITQILGGTFETPVGQRLQIWSAAIQTIKENPVVGVGPTGTSNALRQMSQKGQLSSVGLSAGLSQIHNEVIAHAMRLGMVGLFAILAIYLIPSALFWKGIACRDGIKRNASLMGLLFVVGYMVVGLTIEVFNIKMFATFYALVVAALLAIVRHSDAGSSAESL